MIVIPFLFRGFGILVYFLTLMISIIAGFVSVSKYSFWYGWLIDAFLLSLIGWYVNVKRVVIDAETKEKVVSDAFFIRMEYWGILIGVAAIYNLIKLY